MDVARTHGLAAEADEIRLELQEIRPAELDLKATSATVEIPSEEIRAYLDSFLEVADWRETLRHLGSEGPPGGDPAALDEEVAREAEEFVVQQLFTRTVMGHGTAATRIRAADPQTRRALDQAERRAFHASFWGHLAGDVLAAIPHRHERPDREELAKFFATDLIGTERAERIARAIELFWDGQADECAHLLVPRLESIIREMARLGGIRSSANPWAPSQVAFDR